jgi:hypothetical protein
MLKSQGTAALASAAAGCCLGPSDNLVVQPDRVERQPRPCRRRALSIRTVCQKEREREGDEQDFDGRSVGNDRCGFAIQIAAPFRVRTVELTAPKIALIIMGR